MCLRKRGKKGDKKIIKERNNGRNFPKSEIEQTISNVSSYLKDPLTVHLARICERPTPRNIINY